MIENLSLFDESQIRDPRPTRDAAREAAARRLDITAQQEALVLGYLKEAGNHGGTRDEIGERLGLGHNSVSPLVCKLAGQIGGGPRLIASTPRKRRSRNGRLGTVYVYLWPREEAGK